MTRTLAADVALITDDAYARETGIYSRKQWRMIAALLLERARYSQAAAEWILRSKHMRWADDELGRGVNGRRRMTAERFATYLADHAGEIARDLTQAEVR
jgi:hypothetical protein